LTKHNSIRQITSTGPIPYYHELASQGVTLSDLVHKATHKVGAIRVKFEDPDLEAMLLVTYTKNPVPVTTRRRNPMCAAAKSSRSAFGQEHDASDNEVLAPVAPRRRSFMNTTFKSTRSAFSRGLGEDDSSATPRHQESMTRFSRSAFDQAPADEDDLSVPRHSAFMDTNFKAPRSAFSKELDDEHIEHDEDAEDENEDGTVDED
jgi:hypothetical protein